MEAALGPVVWISSCTGHSCCCRPGHLTCHQQWPALSPQHGTPPWGDQAAICWQRSFTWPLPSWKGEQIDGYSEDGLASPDRWVSSAPLDRGSRNAWSGAMTSHTARHVTRGPPPSGGGAGMGFCPSSLLAWVGFSWNCSAVRDFYDRILLSSSSPCQMSELHQAVKTLPGFSSSLSFADKALAFLIPIQRLLFWAPERTRILSQGRMALSPSPLCGQCP